MFSGKLILMYSSVWGTTNVGVEGVVVQVETHVAAGIPSLKIVGLTNKTIQEASERVLSAIKLTKFRLKAKKIRINLAPSDISKRGAGLDLPIALGILTASSIHINQAISDKRLFAFGELGLNGTVKPTNGMFQFFEQTNNYAGDKLIIAPTNSVNIARFFPNLKFHKVDNLKEALQILSNNQIITDQTNTNATLPTPVEQTDQNLHIPTFNCHNIRHNIDDIRGQKIAKRALLLAATGRHHLLIGGPIGTGKSMLVSTIVSIMPTPTSQELYEIAKIYSARSKRTFPLIPTEQVNKSITRATLLGGGNIITPGKITMAHNGILLVDEFAELDKTLINLLREPLSNTTYVITRNQQTVSLPCRFLLVATTNLCPCGKAGSTETCVCTNRERLQYVKRIPEAVLNRIDIYIRVRHENLSKDYDNIKVHSDYKKLTAAAKTIQLDRYKSEPYKYNSELPYNHFKKHCHMTRNAKQTLSKAVQQFNLNGRDYVKTIRLARTIADLEQTKGIDDSHVFEALSYRTNTLYT